MSDSIDLQILEQALVKVLTEELQKTDDTLPPFDGSRVVQALAQAKNEHRVAEHHHDSHGYQKANQIDDAFINSTRTGTFPQPLNVWLDEQKEHFDLSNQHGFKIPKRLYEHARYVKSKEPSTDIWPILGMGNKTPKASVESAIGVTPHPIDEHLRRNGECVHCNQHVANALGMQAHLPLFETASSGGTIKDMIDYSHEHAPKAAAQTINMPEQPLTKSISDVEPGKHTGVGDLFGKRTKMYDYTHLLPSQSIKDGYKIHLHEYPDKNTLQHDIVATHHGKPMGSVQMEMNKKGNGVKISHLKVNYSDVVAAHRNKGIGQALYEAGYAHGHHVHGATHVLVGTHSSSADAVQRKLVDHHDMTYVMEPEQLHDKPGAPHDEKFGAGAMAF